jgi:hypothetical protein
MRWKSQFNFLTLEQASGTQSLWKKITKQFKQTEIVKAKHMPISTHYFITK